MDHLNKTEKVLLQDIKEKEYKTDGEVVEPETEAEEKTTNGVFWEIAEGRLSVSDLN